MSIRLSDKHGLNPCIPKCYFCNEDKNELYLAGRLPEDAEAQSGKIMDMHPCEECEGYMKQGVLLISVRDGEMEKEEGLLEQARVSFERTYSYKTGRWKRKNFNYLPNPYRTGGWVVITDDAFSRAVTGDAREHILGTRWGFIPDEVWYALGLPRGI